MRKGTRPRKPGFKGHPIEFMILLDPYFGPLWTHLNQFEPIKTQLSHLVPFGKVLTNLDPFGPILTYLDLFGQIWCHLEQFKVLWNNLEEIEPIESVIFFCLQRLRDSFLSPEVA